MIKAGSSELIWLCGVIIEPKHKEILDVEISKERNMFVAERFLSKVVNKYGLRSVSSDDGGTWYPPQACKFLKLFHHIHSHYEKNMIERTSSILKIEPSALMTTFLVKRTSVN